MSGGSVETVSRPLLACRIPKEQTQMRKRPVLGVVAVLAVAGLAVAACGSDSNDSSAATTAVPTTMAATTAPMTAKDIVDTAVAAGSFNTLATALTAAGLVDTL